MDSPASPSASLGHYGLVQGAAEVCTRPARALAALLLRQAASAGADTSGTLLSAAGMLQWARDKTVKQAGTQGWCPHAMAARPWAPAPPSAHHAAPHPLAPTLKRPGIRAQQQEQPGAAAGGLGGERCPAARVLCPFCRPAPLLCRGRRHTCACEQRRGLAACVPQPKVSGARGADRLLRTHTLACRPPAGH